MTDKFGFGLMRLPVKDDQIDIEELSKMVDTYMENGFNYFDTAHGYMQKRSEGAIKEALVKRYPRDSYILTDKLSVHFFNTEEEIRPLFELQLQNTGVEYFDYYLMHAQDRSIYKHFERCNAYKIAKELKEEGKIKHIGISFHDTADVLETILKEHPEIEVVQIQFNYVDYYDNGVQSKAVYEMCRKYNKPVLIMEPIKGGALVRLPDNAKAVLDNIGSGSYASYALRFAASFEGVFKVLSGMGTLEQMQDNIRFMKDVKPLTEEEFKAVKEVRDILTSLGGISCTACRYCTDGCPMNISIPDLFACYNAKKQFGDWNSDYYYGVHTKNKGKASQCIGCGQCEGVCPQHLPIIEHLVEVANTFEK